MLGDGLAAKQYSGGLLQRAKIPAAAPDPDLLDRSPGHRVDL
jgi:hypothetical protein